MQILHSLKDFKCPWKSSVLTLGVFDGMHLGHEALMDKLVKLDHSQARILVTYDPHPDLVLGKDISDQRRELYTYQEKLSLLQKYDLDAVFFLPFNRELASMSALDFLKNILIEKLRAHKIIIGYDQCFGKNRQGDYQFLKDNSNIFDYSVVKVDAVKSENEIISSSYIRNLIKEGNIKKASRMLGRDFCISGLVIRGHQRGNLIGFPTANIDIPDTKVLPREGVYTGIAEFGNNRYRAMINIGQNPTFSQYYLSVEAHILDFSKNIYGESIKIYFKNRLRDEIKFKNAEELKKQLEKDRENTQRIDLQT